jgi:hypothetical protein
VTFSSTELINRHFNVYEPHVREHLSTLRNDGGLERMLEVIDRIKDYRVLFVGDAIIDEYHYVLPRVSHPRKASSRPATRIARSLPAAYLQRPTTWPRSAARSTSSRRWAASTATRT